MGTNWESFKVAGQDVLKRIKQLIHEGNVRRVVVKRGSRTLADFPVTVGVVGVLVVPELGALGALAALLDMCTIEVERGAEAARKPAASARRRKKS